MESRRLAVVEDVPSDGTPVFTIERDGSTREVLSSHLDDGDVVAWENPGQHWVDVRLDEGERAVLRGGGRDRLSEPQCDVRPGDRALSLWAL